MPRQLLPEIDDRRCTLCGDCIDVCPTECLILLQGASVAVSPAECISCGVCEVVCPTDAIAMQSVDW